jgi:hypothetical protein
MKVDHVDQILDQGPAGGMATSPEMQSFDFGPASSTFRDLPTAYHARSPKGVRTGPFSRQLEASHKVTFFGTRVSLAF